VKRLMASLVLALALMTASSGTALGATRAIYISPPSQSVAHGHSMTWTVSWAGPTSTYYDIVFWPEYNFTHNNYIRLGTADTSERFVMAGTYPCRGTSYTQRLQVTFHNWDGSTATMWTTSVASEGGGNPC